MHQFLSLLVALAIFTTLHANPTPSTLYQNHAILDKDGDYHLFWEPDRYKITITFEVHAKTTGYVGLGFSPKGSMANADIIIGWVDGSTQVLKDCHGQDKNGPPDCNESQNVTLLSAASNDTWTMIKFVRKAKLCDKHDLPITEGTMRVIWAMGEKDEMRYHSGRRGTKFMYLMGIKPVDATLPKDVKTFVVTMKNFRVPVNGEGTVYECGIHKLPDMKDKHHVIRFDPIITEGNELHVHHMILSICSIELNYMQGMSSQLNRTGACFDQRLRPLLGFGKCVNSIFTWTVGATNFTFPAHVGVPIGSDHEPKYVRLEIHYDNPTFKHNIVDSSGFRLYYTATLRNHDLGVINMGKIFSRLHMIPPMKTKFMSVSHSPSVCTKQSAFGNYTEVKAIGILPHTHLIGTGVKHRHFRDGTELPPLVDDQSYDFNWQMVKLYNKEITIRPGDDFMVECNYNSLQRKETTLGGLSTRDEMCMTFLWVYPRIPVKVILSSIAFEPHAKFINKHKLPGTTFSTNISELRTELKTNIKWTDTASSEWEYIEKHGKYYAACSFTKGNQTRLQITHGHEPFKITKPYTSTLECLPAASTSVAISRMALTSSLLAVIYLLSLAL